MQIIRQSSLTPVLWKNGGGLTREVTRVPADGNEFLWRVSIAQIDAAGPFSNFAGYTRTMVLLRGDGVSLTFDDGDRSHLRQIGDLVVFDGARSAHCELKGGRCTDLNVMAAKAVGDVHAQIEACTAPRLVATDPRTTSLIFAVAGAVTLAARRVDVVPLDEWDLAVLAPGETVTVAPVGHASAEALVFYASLLNAAI